MSHETFALKIEALSPQSIPMNRLARYMLEFAGLMGCVEHVRFEGVSAGSTIVRAQVHTDIAPLIAARIQAISSNKADANVLKYFDAINDLLREDQTRGCLVQSDRSLIAFQGAEIKVGAGIGPIKETGDLTGQLISVGGKDQTKHVRIMSQHGEIYRLETRNIELAKALAKHLFSLVRVNGSGTWHQDSCGNWKLERFVAESFETLDDTDLITAMQALRQTEGDGWREVPDPQDVLKKLRKG
ncbi:MAG TPA: hypothetical protein VIC30_00275 [Orrella sp.]